MKPWVRSLDWKFLLALAFAVMVAYLAYVGVVSVQSGHEKDRRIDALIAATEAKDRRAQQATEDAARERAQAARERRLMSRNQAALLAYTKTLAHRQTALLTWLRHNGITLPRRFVTEVPAPRLVRHRQTSSRPRSHSARSKARTATTSGSTSATKPGKGKGRGKGGPKKSKRH